MHIVNCANDGELETINSGSSENYLFDKFVSASAWSSLVL